MARDSVLTALAAAAVLLQIVALAYLVIATTGTFGELKLFG